MYLHHGEWKLTTNASFAAPHKDANLRQPNSRLLHANCTSVSRNAFMPPLLAENHRKMHHFTVRRGGLNEESEKINCVHVLNGVKVWLTSLKVDEEKKNAISAQAVNTVARACCTY